MSRQRRSGWTSRRPAVFPGVLCLAVTLAAASCGGGSERGLKGKREVAIAFVGAKTGASAAAGLDFRDGVRLAVEQENERGGGSLSIRLREYDTGGEPAQARAAKAQFIGDQSVLGVVGPVVTGETNALVADFQQANLVTISASATEAGLPSSAASRAVFHRIVSGEGVLAEGVADYLFSGERATSVAYVHDGSESAKQLVTEVERRMADKGVRAATVETVDPKSADVSAAVGRIRAVGVSAVFSAGPFAQAALLNRRLVEQGALVTLVTGQASSEPGFFEAGQAANADGVRLTCSCNLPLETSTGRLGEFYDDYKDRNGRDPGRYAAEGYDAASILIRGIKAGNEDREKLLRYVEEQLGRYEGVSKTVDFAPDGTLRADTFAVYEVRSGKLALLRTLTVGGGTGTTSTTLPTTSTSARTPTTRRRTTTTSTSSPATTSTSSTTTTTLVVPFPP